MTIKNNNENVIKFNPNPSREEAMRAVKTLIAWAGDDPEREGLIETPKRVLKAYEEFFEGYKMDPFEILSKTFEEVEGYDEMVLIKNIRLESHCEHHIVPILGIAHVAYMPKNRVVGISKIARLVDIFAKRLQIQETLTSQIAETLQKLLFRQFFFAFFGGKSWNSWSVNWITLTCIKGIDQSRLFAKNKLTN